MSYIGKKNGNPNTDFLEAGGELENHDLVNVDSSGKLFVGKTSSNTSTSGSEIWEDGFAAHTRAGVPFLLNRLSSDGDIATFRKDGTTVGSIGINGDKFYIAGANEGLCVDDSDNAVMPTNSSGQSSDNVLNLGRSDSRFKDLYLSGGVYVGGTGSANKLDDYEEGTWTPTGNTVTYTSNSGIYTKIGNLVTVTFTIGVPTTSSGSQLKIGGLPFAESSVNLQGQSITHAGSLGYCTFTKASESRVAINNTDLVFYDNSSSTLTEGDASGATVRGTITYKTDA